MRSTSYFSFSGFDPRSTHVACCGAGGPYNYNVLRMCSPLSTICKDPSAYINWDGVHYTEAAYRHMAEGLLSGPFTSPRLFN